MTETKYAQSIKARLLNMADGDNKKYLRFVRELEQGEETLRLDKVNQVLALFGAVMTPGKISES